jgi:hypothetical protein
VFITRDFVFLHVPKTGGTFMNRVCGRHFEIVLDDPDLQGVKQIPAEFSSLPKFALVRNPWDWHVSFYEFTRRNPPWAEELTSGSFEDFLGAELGPAALGRCLYMAILIGTIGRFRDPVVSIGKTESLADDFLAFLSEHDISQPEALRADLTGPRINVTERGDYREYYDEGTRDQVARSCRLLIRRFGYEF